MTQIEMAAHLSTHQRRLYAIAHSMMGNEQDALDALSEVAYRACLKCGGLRQESAVVSWLGTITVNCCRMALRKRKYHEDASQYMPSVPDDTSTVDLREMVEHLPLRIREIVLLRYYADMRYADIARALHMPESTVRSRHKQALEALRLQWEEEE